MRSLDDQFFYQNAKTGEASSTAVSVRQLCKILSTKTTQVTAETLVFDPKTAETALSTSSLPSSQWVPLKDVAILKEACADWYYTTKNPTSSERMGPVGVKQLQQKREDIHMVYSTLFSDKGWFPIEDSPDLLQAMQAFETPPPSPPIGKEEQEADTLQQLDVAETTDAENQVQKELEAFLQSTGASSSSSHQHIINNDDDEDEAYESDGGTTYVKDHMSGNWMHEALAPKKATPITGGDFKTQTTSTNKNNNDNKRDVPDETSTNPTNKRKRKKAKFAARNAKCWIYVSGLPLDTSEEEVAQVFGKVGILDLDGESQKPKVKLYSTMEDKTRVLKGDGSVCFARPESVDLAISLFDQAPFRLDDPTSLLHVERAKFEQRGESYQAKHHSWQKRQVAKKAALQAVGWDEGKNGRITGGKKGLTIIVLKHMFTPQQANDDTFLQEMEGKIRTECSEFGTVEKITVFASNPQGVVVIRFREPTAATAAIQHFNGRSLGDDRKIEAHFWDGVTNYTVKDEEKEIEEEEVRHEQFGEWLESQEELPEEFRLQVES